MHHIVVISKDILCRRYLPTYGNKYWKTPNIDELAAKGTIFRRHYTAAPSTAMAFTSMFTGLYPYETGRADYSEVRDFNEDGGVTLFDALHEKGYNCHLLWSKNYIVMAEKFSKCFGKDTVHHDTLSINQYVGPHVKGCGEVKRDDDEVEKNYADLMAEIDTIDRSNPVFLWVHLPHVFKGRTGYGDDIDILDRFVGDIRKRFGDYIFVTADHGCDDGKNGNPSYGFHLSERAIRIPLIAPRLEGVEEYNGLTSNKDLFELVLNAKIPKHDYVFTDTAYYQQPRRKLAIVSERYKFVYDKLKKKKYLFDLIEDPEESIDLTCDTLVDHDRHRKIQTKQTVFYPYWEEAEKALDEFNKIFDDMWNNGKEFINKKNYMRGQIKLFFSKLKGMYKVIKRK